MLYVIYMLMTRYLLLECCTRRTHTNFYHYIHLIFCILLAIYQLDLYMNIMMDMYMDYYHLLQFN